MKKYDQDGITLYERQKLTKDRAGHKRANEFTHIKVYLYTSLHS